jgi:hypothetical protein
MVKFQDMKKNEKKEAVKDKLFVAFDFNNGRGEGDKFYVAKMTYNWNLKDYLPITLREISFDEKNELIKTMSVFELNPFEKRYHQVRRINKFINEKLI